MYRETNLILYFKSASIIISYQERRIVWSMCFEGGRREREREREGEGGRGREGERMMIVLWLSTYNIM